jgi:hypothetical protein
VKGSVENNQILNPGIFTDADVRYRVQGGAVKEDIILHSYQGQNTFSFELKLNGVKSTVKEDGPAGKIFKGIKKG